MTLISEIYDSMLKFRKFLINPFLNFLEFKQSNNGNFQFRPM